MSKYNQSALPGPPDEPSVEQYNALEEYIADLQAERRPAVPDESASADLDALRIATLMHAALPGVDEPEPDFVAGLAAQLEARLTQGENSPTASPVPMAQSPVPSQPPARVPRTSRRSVLAAGLAAAAGMAAGIGGGIVLGEQGLRGNATPTHVTPPLVGLAGVWIMVAKVAAVVPGSAVRFATPALVGHLVRRSDGGFVAFSAACTHMGCIVAWNGPQRTFDCPCHNGRFDAQGQPLPSQPIQYSPLPQLATRITDEEVYVYVPTSSTAPVPTPDVDGYQH